jgi:N-acetylglucosaminyldiphosphoundecaprenol N-acetyl-beta-D-mannosaminyltransferase
VTIPRTNVLGVGISAIHMRMALETVDAWILDRSTRYICVTDVHAVMECQRDDKLRQIHNAAGLVAPDGMPLVWLSRLHGFKHVDRVYGPDLMLALCEHSIAKGYRNFFYGGGAGVTEKLVANLKKRFPALQVAGVYTPPFGPLSEGQDQQMVQTVNEARPDIVWVGLGAPKQERWMAEHVGRLTAPVLIGVGAAFDFHAGLKKQAPRWMQRGGLEWFFRLITEPGRLWRRYLTIIPAFLGLTLLQVTGMKRYPMK